jgi:hypothetical protein
MHLFIPASLITNLCKCSGAFNENFCLLHDHAFSLILGPLLAPLSTRKI